MVSFLIKTGCVQKLFCVTDLCNIHLALKKRNTPNKQISKQNRQYFNKISQYINYRLYLVYVNAKGLDYLLALLLSNLLLQISNVSKVFSPARLPQNNLNY